MTLDDQIRKEIEATPEEAAEDIATRVVAQVDRSELIRLVTAKVEGLQRERARVVERRVFRDIFDTPRAGRPMEPLKWDQARDKFPALFRETFALGDGRRVTWGEATREDHMERMTMIHANIAGQMETYRQHEYTLKVLEDTGTQCLREAAAIVPIEIAI